MLVVDYIVIICVLKNAAAAANAAHQADMPGTLPGKYYKNRFSVSIHIYAFLVYQMLKHFCFFSLEDMLRSATQQAGGATNSDPGQGAHNPLDG